MPLSSSPASGMYTPLANSHTLGEKREIREERRERVREKTK
jgi:hypothetical protein